MVNPPRERPSAWFCVPLFAGSAAMRPDRGAVDHLQHVGIAAAVRQCLQKHVPHARETPATELLVHRVPVAQHLRQVAPWSAGAADPKHPVQHLAMVLRRATAERRGARQERREDSPFLVRHQASDHCQPPTQRSASKSHSHRVGESPRDDRQKANPSGTVSNSFRKASRQSQILLLPAPVQSITEHRKTTVCPQGLDPERFWILVPAISEVRVSPTCHCDPGGRPGEAIPRQVRYWPEIASSCHALLAVLAMTR